MEMHINPHSSQHSVENNEANRNAQQDSQPVLSEEERRNLAAQLGEGPNAVVGLKDLGTLSGRDAAGSGPENETPGDATGR